MKKTILSVVLAVLAIVPLYAQSDNVRLFQSYFYDAPIAKTGYGQGGLMYANYDLWNNFRVGVMGGYPLNDKIELGTQLFFVNFSPDKGDGQSGISDIDVFGRYNVFNQDKTNISAGAMISLPIGSEDVLEGNLDFGAFGAARHALSSQISLVGTLGLMFYEKKDVKFNYDTFKLEEKTSYDSYLNIGAGLIYAINDQLNVVGELNIKSEGDYMLLSAGMDYALGTGRLRAGLGLGLDDGAPDLLLMAGYGISLSK